jgi:hypothetical protein
MEPKLFVHSRSNSFMCQNVEKTSKLNIENRKWNSVDLTDNKDAMNFDIVKKVCSKRVTECLNGTHNLGTRLYLELISYVMKAYIDEDTLPLDRVYAMVNIQQTELNVHKTRSTLNLSQNVVHYKTSQNSQRLTFAQTLSQSRPQQQTRQQWSAQPRLAAAAAAQDIFNASNFPYLSQQSNIQRVASQASEFSLNKLPTLQAEFLLLQKKLLEIPKLEKSLLKVREIIDQLKQTDIYN